MVCTRCIMVVKQLLENLQLHPLQVSMGEVELAASATAIQLEKLNSKLKEVGFELLDSQRQKQIEKIRNLLIQKVQSGEIEEHFTITEFIGTAMNKDYNSLSRLFSEVAGVTVEQFFILQKIEKVKEWLVYGEWNLNEIAYRLGYSSVSHLSAQFKKITGLTPSHFKKSGGQRKSLDKL